MNKKMLFRHTRSGEIYEYICSAENTETKEPMVVYTKHKILQGEPRKIYARPYDSFFSTVKDNGAEVDRFVKIEE